MMYIQENYDAWYKKFEMYPRSSKCVNCGKEVIVDQPVLSTTHQGLASAVHECGEEYRIIRLRPRLKSKRTELNEALDFLVPNC